MQKVAIALGLIAVVAVPAVAGEGVAAGQEGPNKIVCRTEGITGSRLGSRKRCKTIQEWSEITRLDRQAIERIQANRYNGNESGQAGIQGDFGRNN